MIVTSKSSRDISSSYVVRKLNETMSELFFKLDYITIVVAVINQDQKALNIYNAGHPPVLIYNSSTKKCEAIDHKGGIPVGWNSNFNYSSEDEDNVTFTDEDKIYLYSDGIFEADKEGKELGIENLQEYIQNVHQPVSIEDEIFIPDYLINALVEDDYNFKSDDVTLLQISSHVKKSNYHIQEIELSIEEVANIAIFSENFVKDNFSPRVGFAVELIVTELLNNVIKHGEFVDNKDAVFLIKYDEKRVTLKFYDSGKKWVPSEVIRDEYSTSGRGIEIINNLSENYDYIYFGNYSISKILITEESVNNSMDNL